MINFITFVVTTIGLYVIFVGNDALASIFSDAKNYKM